MPPTTRFAPSPTGLLHLGHAFAAIYAYDLAYDSASNGGRFIVRMEDLDRGRCRPEFTRAIRDDLHWLGLSWEQPMLAQSTRGHFYQEALARLARAQLVYPCFCTRREIADEMARAVEAPHETALGSHVMTYPGTCRVLSDNQRQQRIIQGRPYALRLDARKASPQCGKLTFFEMGRGPRQEHGVIQVDPLLFGDIVLARKDLPAAYHLAVVLDDAFQGITLVTRGSDLFAATHVQRVLQSLLQLPTPRYSHHRLILDEHGRKFSKRDRAQTLQSLRESGINPAQIRQRLGI
jgi:glutamyl-Q tRNA(Asp) synthetase